DLRNRYADHGFPAARRACRSLSQRFKRGSRASRRPSPSMLNASVVRKMAIPGNTTSQGLVSINTRFAFRSHPQLGVGGCVPNPKKLSDDSMRIEVDTESVLVIIIGAMQLGSTWWNKTRQRLSARARTASIYSFSLTDRTLPLTTRA